MFQEAPLQQCGVKMKYLELTSLFRESAFQISNFSTKNSKCTHQLAGFWCLLYVLSVPISILEYPLFPVIKNFSTSWQSILVSVQKQIIADYL